MTHKRKVYDVNDMIGYFGGIEYMIMYLFATLIAPFAEYSFNLKAIAKLFNVRTD